MNNRNYLKAVTKSKLLGGCFLFLQGFGTILGQTSAPSDSAVIRSIYDEVLTNGEAYENLRVLTKTIGHRVVLVRTGDLLDSHGITTFVVERSTPGFSGGKKENKLGMRCSETSEMVFDNCRVHESQILGEVGEGFIQAMKVLDGGRISIGAMSLGIAQGAYDTALSYSKERKQFGQAISRFQAIAFKLADMAVSIEISDLLLLKACTLKNAGKPCTLASAMAKYESSEVAVKVSTEAVQILGGYGYTKDFPAEKYYRDSKLCTIGEGTSEIQKLVIARELVR